MTNESPLIDAYREDLENICMKLYRLTKKKFIPQKFLFHHLNKQAHPGAILRAFQGLQSAIYKKGQLSSPWAYCEQILKVENGNYREKDHRKSADADKKAFNKFCESLEKMMKGSNI